MAEIQLEVLYRPPRLRRLFEAFSRPWYVWLIVLPTILQFAAAINLLLHGLQFDSSMLEGTTWFGLYVMLTCIGISMSQVGQNFKVRLSKEGISLPAILLMGHKIPTDLIWAQVKEATVIGAAEEARLVFTGLYSRFRQTGAANAVCIYQERSRASLTGNRALGH